MARKVFGYDEQLNEINIKAASITIKLIENNPDDIHTYLYLFTIIRKLERIGDLTKNIAEDLIFFIEAKVLKHQKEKN